MTNQHSWATTSTRCHATAVRAAPIMSGIEPNIHHVCLLGCPQHWLGLTRLVLRWSATAARALPELYIRLGEPASHVFVICRGYLRGLAAGCPRFRCCKPMTAAGRAAAPRPGNAPRSRTRHTTRATTRSSPGRSRTAVSPSRRTRKSSSTLPWRSRARGCRRGGGSGSSRRPAAPARGSPTISKPPGCSCRC
jgi:hypothetical protein